MNSLSWLTLNYESFGTSIFSSMTQAAQKYSAVNLAQGFPSFDGPDEIKQAACAGLLGKNNQYAPSAGNLELRQKIAARQLKKLKLNYNADDEVTVFSGATEALFCSFQAFFKPEDEILVFEPFFDCYPAGIFSVKARMISVELKSPDWSIDWENLEKTISKKTRGLLINTPHNPTGKVFSSEELMKFAELAKKHDLLILSDEVYDELYFDNNHHHSIAEFAQERTVVISSFAKTFSFTGWKVGYAFAPKILTKGLRLVHQFTVFCSATPLQMGLLKAFDLPESYFDHLRKEYLQRRDFLFKSLIAVGFTATKPQGSYFIMADINPIRAKFTELKNMTDLEFALWLTEKGVACLPTSTFYTTAEKNHSYVRFAFCKDLETLAEADLRLRKIFKV